MRKSIAQVKWLMMHPSSKGCKVFVFYRWLYWQIRQRMTSKPKIIKFLNRSKLMVYPREGLTGYWYLSRPDFEEITFLEKFLLRNDVFYDVGANAGAYSVLAAGQGCDVVAFEPVPHTFERLVENAEINDRSLFSLLNCAVGSSLGNLKITTNYGPGNHILGDGEIADFVEVKVVTLDSLVATYGFPTFIKADVEGFELEMLRGAGSLLASPELLGLLLETFRPHNWQQPKLQAIELLLREHGFLPFRYDAHANKVIQLTKPDEGENNTLYFRAPDEIQKRLRAYPSSLDETST